MVIENLGAYDEDVFYSGSSEVEAYKIYRNLKNQNKKVNIIKANVVRKVFKNVPFIWSYDVIEYIK